MLVLFSISSGVRAQSSNSARQRGPARRDGCPGKRWPPIRSRVSGDSSLHHTVAVRDVQWGCFIVWNIESRNRREPDLLLWEEDLLRSRGVNVEVLQNDVCTGMLQQFVAQHPQVWCEDIGAIGQSAPACGADTDAWNVG